jgi:hypothetical protein
MEFMISVVLFIFIFVVAINLLSILLIIFCYAVLPITLFIFAVKFSENKILCLILVALSIVSGYFLFPEMVRQVISYKWQA